MTNKNWGTKISQKIIKRLKLNLGKKKIGTKKIIQQKFQVKLLFIFFNLFLMFN